MKTSFLVIKLHVPLFFKQFSKWFQTYLLLQRFVDNFLCQQCYQIKRIIQRKRVRNFFFLFFPVNKAGEVKRKKKKVLRFVRKIVLRPVRRLFSKDPDPHPFRHNPTKVGKKFYWHGNPSHWSGLNNFDPTSHFLKFNEILISHSVIISKLSN